MKRKSFIIPCLFISCWLSCDKGNNVTLAVEQQREKTETIIPTSSDPEDVSPFQSRTIEFSRPDGGYSVAYYLEDFGNDINHNGYASFTPTYASRAYTQDSTWVIKLLANQIGNAGGMWPYVSIGRSTSTKVLEYDVRFGDDTNVFEFGWGGKIPGLGGGKNYSGCNATTAGDGWTSRVMWRTDNLGKAYFIPYIYYVDKPSTCGDNFNQTYYGHDGSGLVSGKWYHVKMEVQMNTGEAYNGKLKITVLEQEESGWSDPQVLIEKHDIRFATKSEGLEIDQILTGVFRGGSTLDWSVPTDGYVYFDNFRWYN